MRDCEGEGHNHLQRRREGLRELGLRAHQLHHLARDTTATGEARRDTTTGKAREEKTKTRILQRDDGWRVGRRLI